MPHRRARAGVPERAPGEAERPLGLGVERVRDLRLERDLPVERGAEERGLPVVRRVLGPSRPVSRPAGARGAAGPADVPQGQIEEPRHAAALLDAERSVEVAQAALDHGRDHPGAARIRSRGDLDLADRGEELARHQAVARVHQHLRRDHAALREPRDGAHDRRPHGGARQVQAVHRDGRAGMEEDVGARRDRVREDDRVQRGLRAEASLGLRLGAERLETVQDRARIGAAAVDAEEEPRPVRHQILSAPHDGDEARRRSGALDRDPGHVHAVAIEAGQEGEPHGGADPTLQGVRHERIGARRDLEAVALRGACPRGGAREGDQGQEEGAPHQK